MLGFATVDVVPDETYTVWLTSRTEATRASHTNAVVFRFDDPEPWERRLPAQMVADRAILLTERTDPGLARVERYLTADDIAVMAAAADDLQAVVSKAFDDYRSRPGKADLVEPTFPRVPEPVDQRPLVDRPPAERTLVVANALARTWSAWLGTEQERVKRRYVPWLGEPQDQQVLREFPSNFADRIWPHPLEQYR